ncbi:MAG: glycosyltransferase, partial [Spirochaetia bacterium]
MLTIFFLLISAAMLVVHVVIVLGAFVSLLREHSESAGSYAIDPGRVSVIIPARNEEKLLPRLLAGLEAQDTEGFEIILVNDRSEDRTGEIMERFSLHYPGSGKVRIVSIKEEPQPGNPKQQALAAGVSAARGDILL